MSTPITLPTSDGVVISSDYYSGTNGSAVVLAHMLGRDGGAWGDFPVKLNGQGYTVLNIDLRGHGRSTTQNGQTINFQNFSEQEFNKMPLDLEAAKKYLVQNGMEPTKIHYLGASIGANAALIAASQDRQIKSIVLLSPGENYHGVKTFDAAKNYSRRPALIISSSDDSQSYQSSQQISSFIGPSAKFIGLSDAGHGNAVLTAGPTLEQQIISFLQVN